MKLTGLGWVRMMEKVKVGCMDGMRLCLISISVVFGHDAGRWCVGYCDEGGRLAIGGCLWNVSKEM